MLMVLFHVTAYSQFFIELDRQPIWTFLQVIYFYIATCIHSITFLTGRHKRKKE